MKLFSPTLRCLSLAAAICVLLASCGRPTSDDQSTAPAPAPDAPARVTASDRANVELEPSAAPTQPTPPAGPPSFLDRYSFVGLAPVASEQGSVKAIIVDNETGQTHLKSTGETINDVSIREVRTNPPLVVLERGQEIGMLELGQLPQAVKTVPQLTTPGAATPTSAPAVQPVPTAVIKPGTKQAPVVSQLPPGPASAPSAISPTGTPPTPAPDLILPPPPNFIPPPPPNFIPPPPPDEPTK